MSKPLVLVPCDVKPIPGGGPFHCVGEKYLDAVVHGADCMVLLLPALGHGHEMDSFEAHYDLDALLDMAQGVFLPGSASNIHPDWYTGRKSEMSLDEQRDTTVFALIERVLARKMPLLAVCRGLQELNVALGGTLHPNVQDVPGFMDHREDKTAPRELQYEPAHPVELTPGGVLAGILGAGPLQVNSLHAQGIATLGRGLAVEASAEDGLVEAVSLPGQWVLGVQWHPEWRYDQNPAAVRLFEAFGKAIRKG
ncbi:MAG: gamma-glutamyl-gamma-aminobutyrate hydrolase family protein [Pseudomonadales bacterium]|nr:gamma-glutamyl-gamma-aminobutyrate hydrolase family protein [Pseudomonadales bacterium]